MASDGFSESLRAMAGEQWNRVIHHRFTKELAQGQLEPRMQPEKVLYGFEEDVFFNWVEELVLLSFCFWGWIKKINWGGNCSIEGAIMFIEGEFVYLRILRGGISTKFQISMDDSDNNNDNEVKIRIPMIIICLYFMSISMLNEGKAGQKF